MREPLGVVGAITPWNSPLTLTTSKLAPALCAGNTVVIKPSEYTSATVLRLAELVERGRLPARRRQRRHRLRRRGRPGAGRPPATSPRSPSPAAPAPASRIAAGVGRALPRLDARAGRQVARTSSSRTPTSPTPPWASSPASSPLPARRASPAAGSSPTARSTTSCSRRVAERARTIRIGDPLDEATELGPAGLRGPARQGRRLRRPRPQRGRPVLTGGHATDGGLGGYFYEPTVLVDVDNEHARRAARRSSARSWR